MKQKIVSFITAFCFLVILVLPVFAAETECIGYGPFATCEKNSQQQFNSTFSIVIQIMLVGAALTALFFAIQGALKYMQSGGDPKTLDSAQKEITWSFVGLVMIFITFVFYGLVVNNILGIGTYSNGNFSIPFPTLGGK
jgi:heme/copper-type cytochrome/quinol oxidase subunit 2